MTNSERTEVALKIASFAHSFATTTRETADLLAFALMFLCGTQDDPKACLKDRIEFLQKAHDTMPAPIAAGWPWNVDSKEKLS